MKKQLIYTFIAIMLSTASTQASCKVYLIHGLAGLGLELDKINNALQSQSYETEIINYASLSQDVNIVAEHLYLKIRQEQYDTVCFVTHSLGALVVRSMYQYLDPNKPFPYIHRMVMIASPNQGSPVADFWAQFDFVKYLAGPNVKNLTTDINSGAAKFPIPTCEIGLIAGKSGRKAGFNIFIVGDNDGLVPVENAAIGNEKDVVFVKAPHVSLVFNKKVINYVIHFLKYGSF